ncbi:hypothetical protein [Orenia marismortui]|uniref:hypothetical protein n=1 Tax=Orenia marismortui TaxID=46469 RepID=UPI000373AEB1|nr:hypothetical protein [Orenia marismortui]
MGQNFTETLNLDGDGRRMTTIAQTRDGKEEFLGIVAGYEYNKNSGLWYPPGVLPDEDVGKPRMEVSQNGQIESTKMASRSGDLATSTEEIVASIKKEVIVHDITAYFEESTTPLRFRLEFWNGATWELYTFPLSPDYFGSEITPGTCSHNGIFEQVGTTNFIKMKKEKLQIKGIRIVAGNYTTAAKRLDISMLYSEV